MVVIGTQKELDWLFDALGTAGLCDGCPARPVCTSTDDAEEAQGIPIPERVSCGEMQRSAIEIVLTQKAPILTRGRT